MGHSREGPFAGVVLLYGSVRNRHLMGVKRTGRPVWTAWSMPAGDDLTMIVTPWQTLPNGDRVRHVLAIDRKVSS